MRRRTYLRTLVASGALAAGVGTNVTGTAVQTAAAQNSSQWSHQARLFADDGAEDDQFGQAVAIDGNTALVGARNDNNQNGDGAGSAHVFERTNGKWSQQAKLVAPDGDGDRNDQFGFSVAMDGETVLVGTPLDNEPNGNNTGSAYVFKRTEGEWSQQAKLAADDGAEDDGFGKTVSVDGDTALVGARDDDNPNGFGAGSAYVFKRTDGDWSQQAKLTADDGAEEDKFGFSVAVDGNTVLVGAREDDIDQGGNTNLGQGSAYVFKRTNGEWSQQAKLTVNDGDNQTEFGQAVAVDGNTALVGAIGQYNPNGEDAGSAYVFKRTNGEWSQQAKLVAPDGDRNDEFGFSVAIDGNTALIGAENDDDPGRFSVGSAYIFERTDGEWSSEVKLTAADAENNDQFGSSVSINGDTALIGARTDRDPVLDRTGVAHVFTSGTDGPTVPPEGSVRVTLEQMSDQPVDVGSTKEVDVVVKGVDNGIGSYEFEVAVGDSTTTRINSVSPAGTDADDPLTSIDVASDGTTASVATGDTDPGGATIATLTIEGVSRGTTDLSVSNVGVVDVDDNNYAITSVSGTTLTVERLARVVLAQTSDEPVGVDSTTRIDVVVEDVDNGIGLYEFEVTVGDTQIARIDSVSPVGTSADDPQTSVEVAGDGAAASVATGLLNLEDTTIATLTVSGVSEGTTDLSISNVSVLDSSGENYTIESLSETDLTVADTGEPTVDQYRNENGIVEASGLLSAAADFRNGEIEAATLLKVAAAFRSGESVT